MSPDSNDRWRPPEPPGRPPRPPMPPRAPSSRSRWLPWVVPRPPRDRAALLPGRPQGWRVVGEHHLLAVPLAGPLRPRRHDQVRRLQRPHHRAYKKGDEYNGKSTFSTTGPTTSMPDADIQLLISHNVGRDYKSHGSNILGSILTLLLPVVLIIGFFVWMSRRAQGQMGAVMNIGRSTGEGLQHRETEDDVRRRRRLRTGEGRDQGGRRLPEDARASSARSARASRRACCSSARREPARRSSHARSPVRRACRSSR